MFRLTKITNSSCNSMSKKQANQKNGHFFKEDIQIAKNHMRRCSTSLIIREMQSKLQRGITSYQPEWPSSKSPQTVNGREGVEKKEPSYTVGGNVNLYNCYGKQCGGSFKN